MPISIYVIKQPDAKRAITRYGEYRRETLMPETTNDVTAIPGAMKSKESADPLPL
ncbi:MAG: hypothetical protein GXO82_07375 [Chlorobi bacterium]|nr:hypothetical protein [Chlorobiota bacterium]